MSQAAAAATALLAGGGMARAALPTAEPADPETSPLIQSECFCFCPPNQKAVILTVAAAHALSIWGFHSSTFQLNLSALCGIGVACRGYVARVKVVLVRGRVCRVFYCVRHGSS